MKFDLKSLIGSLFDTIRDPRAGARAVMQVEMARRHRWEILVLVIVLSVWVLKFALTLGESDAAIVFGGNLMNDPIAAAASQSFVLFMLVFAVYFVGTRAGGSGSLDDTILLVAWLQFILVCLNLVQTLVFIISPVFGALIGLAGFGLFFWLLTNFVAELHGFQSRGNVFVSILMCFVGFAILISIVLAMLGVQMVGA